MNNADLVIYPIPAFTDNYIWVITEVSMKQAIIVDPGDAKPVIATLEKTHTKPIAILLTHHHSDHSAGIGGLQDHYGEIPVYTSKESQAAVMHRHTDSSFSVTINNQAVHIDVIAIAGHTLDHVGFYTKGHLFCGDTLFTGGCGRVFEGTHDQLLQSLNTLCTLPDETLIYCGHEYTVNNLHFAKALEPNNEQILKRLSSALALRASNKPTVPSTLHLEKQTNPFLRCHQPQIIVAVEQHFNIQTTVDKEVFRWVRTWKDQFKG